MENARKEYIDCLPYMVVSLRNNSAWKIREKDTGREVETHTIGILVLFFFFPFIFFYYFLRIITLLECSFIQNLTEMKAEIYLKEHSRMIL